MTPPPASIMREPNSWHMNSVPLMSTAMTRSRTGSLSSRQLPCSGATSPTLFTRTSKRPRLSKDVARHSLHLVPARNVRLDHDAVATKATNLLREHSGAFARAVVVGDDVCPLAREARGPRAFRNRARRDRHERPLILKASCLHCPRLYNKCLIRRRATGHGSAGLTATRPILPSGIDRPSARGSCSTAPYDQPIGRFR